MSELLLYAVADGPPGELPGPGERDAARLRAIGEPGLVAVVGERPGELSAEALWRFATAVADQMGARTVLPARYGLTLGDEADALALLAERRSEWLAGLDRVRGAVEVGVRVSWPRPPERPGTAAADRGTAYLCGSAERRRRAQRISARLEARLGGSARESCLRVTPRDAEAVVAAFLVAAERAQEFMTAAGALEPADLDDDDVRITCTGPWPPYSFVAADRDG